MTAVNLIWTILPERRDGMVNIASSNCHSTFPLFKPHEKVAWKRSNHIVQELSDLIAGSGESIIRLKEGLGRLGFNLSAGQELCIAVSLGKGSLSFHSDIPCAALKLGYRKKGYILQPRSLLELEKFLKSRLSRDISSIGIVTSITAVEHIHKSMEIATIMAYQSFISGRGDVYRYSPFRPSMDAKYLHSVDEIIRSGDISAIDAAFKKLREMFADGSSTIKHAYKLYNIIMSYLSGMEKEDEEAYVLSYEQLPIVFGDIDAMLDYLKKAVMQNVCNSVRTHDDENKIIKEIVKYIQNNYLKEISVNALAQEFYITPNYMCNLFRKETQETIVEYISRLRMEHACKLLRNTNLSIGEVSERSGYSNYFYFARVFKKLIGATPSQYRAEGRMKQ